VASQSRRPGCGEPQPGLRRDFHALGRPPGHGQLGTTHADRINPRPAGRCREWRITTPNGETITAPELTDLRTRDHDLTYLQSRSSELAAKLAGSTMAFSPDEAHLLRAALQLMIRVLPVQIGRRGPSC